MECSRQVDTRPVSPTYTVAFEVYPESEGVFLEMVGVFRLRSVMSNASFPRAVFESKAGEEIGSVYTRPDEWNSMALQIKSNNSESYPGDIWITVFVNGSVRPSNTVLRLGYPMPINGTNNPIYLGQATIQHSSDPVFHGMIRNVKIYQQILTDREIYALDYGKLPVISPNSECLCPQAFPSVETELRGLPDLEVYCKSRSSLAGHVPRLVDSDTGRLFSTDYLTDGQEENSEHYPGLPRDMHFIPSGFRMWASTPGLSQFYLIMDLQDLTVVTLVGFVGMVMPATATYTLEQYNQTGWQEIQRFVTRNLPCGFLDDSCVLMLRDHTAHWNVPGATLHNFVSPVITKKLRLHFDGNFTSNQDFYLVTEFWVTGSTTDATLEIDLVKSTNYGPDLLTWIEFNPSMDKRACDCTLFEDDKRACRPEWGCEGAEEADQTTPSTSSSPGGEGVHLSIALALLILAAATPAAMFP